MNKVIMVLVGLVIGIGLGYFIYPEKIEVKKCDEPSMDVKYKDQAVKACIEKGGIPIFSAWDNRLARCEFK